MRNCARSWLTYGRSPGPILQWPPEATPAGAVEARDRRRQPPLVALALQAADVAAQAAGVEPLPLRRLLNPQRPQRPPPHQLVQRLRRPRLARASRQ
jgi:hypothetical protein